MPVLTLLFPHHPGGSLKPAVFPEQRGGLGLEVVGCRRRDRIVVDAVPRLGPQPWRVVLRQLPRRLPSSCQPKKPNNNNTAERKDRWRGGQSGHHPPKKHPKNTQKKHPKTPPYPVQQDRQTAQRVGTCAPPAGRRRCGGRCFGGFLPSSLPPFCSSCAFPPNTLPPSISLPFLKVVGFFSFFFPLALDTLIETDF